MSRNRGFTLIEVLVALSITALVILGARALLHQIADTADRITSASTNADRIANTERTVRGLFDHTVAADSADAFIGRETSLRFISWCEVPSGWSERCVVSATLHQDTTTLSPDGAGRESASDTSVHPRLVLDVRTSAGDTLQLRSKGTHGGLRYVAEAAGGGSWVSSWKDSARTPLAVGVATDRDTIIFRIGMRR